MHEVAEPRLETIEGRQTLIVVNRPKLQPKLVGLLSALSHVRVARDIRPSGMAAQCERDREHRFETLREGRHVGLDGVVRDLRILMCLDCGAAQVRDISYDTTVAGEPVPRSGRPKRRDLVIGWYTGRRAAGREYR